MTKSPSIMLAAFWMAGALSSFLLMAVSGRELSISGLNTFQILFWRSLVGVLVAAVLLQIYGWSQARTGQPWTQITRNFVHFAAQFGWFYGLAHITLAEVFAIEFTLPVWTLLLAALLLGEAITRTRMLAVALGFIGILVILRPGFQEIVPAQFAVLAAAVGYALTTYVLTKKLVRTDTPLTILFYMSAIQLPLGFVASLSGWVWPDPAYALWVVLVGLSGLSAHFCMARALQHADANVVVPMDFLRMPLSAIVGFLVYAEVIDVWVLVGAGLIFFGNYLNVAAERKKSASRSATGPTPEDAP